MSKDELSACFSVSLIENAKDTDKSYVIAYRNNVMSTTGLHQHLASNQIETDTKIILRATDAYSRGVAKIDIHSADTDVFILSLGHFDSLCEHIIIAIGSKQRQRKIPLAVIRKALGDLKAKALIGFHALSGADITGSMSGKGNILCWQAFSIDGRSIREAFGSLGSVPLADTAKDALAECVCILYQQGTNISWLNELRW